MARRKIELTRTSFSVGFFQFIRRIESGALGSSPRALMNALANVFSLMLYTARSLSFWGRLQLKEMHVAIVTRLRQEQAQQRVQVRTDTLPPQLHDGGLSARPRVGDSDN